MKNNEEIIKLGCLECILSRKKGFVFNKKEKTKVFTCSCLEEDKEKNLLICEDCKKHCHTIGDHETTEIGEKRICDFLCACKPILNEEESHIKFNKHANKIDCLFYEPFVNDKSFFKKLANQQDKFVCLFCEESCYKGIEDHNLEYITENTMALFICSCPKMHTCGVETYFKKINDLISNIDQVNRIGKRTNLMKLFNLLLESKNFKIYFEVFSIMTSNCYEKIKIEKLKNEDSNTICKNVAKFIKLYYKFALAEFSYANNYISGIINFTLIKKMFSKLEFKTEFKLRCLKIFKYLIFNSVKKTNFIRSEKDKNSTVLHRLLFSQSIDEIFDNNPIIKRDEYFELLDILIRNVKMINEIISEEYFLLIFIQYLDFLNFICHCKDIDFNFIKEACNNINVVVTFLIKKILYSKDKIVKKRKDKIVDRVESISYLLFLKINDKSIYNCILDIHNKESSKIELESKDYQVELSKFVFEKDEINQLIIYNLFSLLDSEEKHISKIDILDMSMTDKDYYEEALINICKSNLDLNFNLITLMKIENTKEFGHYYTKYHEIYSQFEIQSKMYIEGKLVDEKTFYEKIQYILANIKEIYQEIDRDVKSNFELQHKQLVFYKIGYLDLVYNILRFFTLNKYLKKFLNYQEFRAFYKLIIEVVSIIIENNPLLIRLILSKYYINVLCTYKKQTLIIDFIYFFEKQLKVLRENNLKADVVFFCYIVGDTFKHEYSRYVAKTKFKNKESKKDFLIKVCMIMACLKVCIEISIRKNIYIVNKNLFNLLIFILKENDDNIKEESSTTSLNSKIKKRTLFNKILYKLSTTENIELKDRGKE